MNCNFRDVNNSSKKLKISEEILKLVNELYKKDISVLLKKLEVIVKYGTVKKLKKLKFGISNH